MTSGSNDKDSQKSRVSYVGAGTAIGVGVGLAIGTAMGNVGGGLAIGIALGVGIGAGMQRKQKSTHAEE